MLANRIWHHLIGRGLVRTVDNFGTTGERPSHPELLDYLAQRLIDSGWSIKSLVREIVLSHTFALSSQKNSAYHESDPENQYLWRGNRRRLDPESFRDAMLIAAGQLDLSPMNSTSGTWVTRRLQSAAIQCYVELTFLVAAFTCRSFAMICPRYSKR